MLAYDLDPEGTWLEFEHADRYYHVRTPAVFHGGFQRVARVDDVGDQVYVFVEFVNEPWIARPLGVQIVARRQAVGTQGTAVVRALFSLETQEPGVMPAVQAPKR